MDQQQAERALEVIRGVIEHTRDDLVQRNWGLIWMVVAFVDFVASASGTFIDKAALPVWWYAVPLLIAAVVNAIVVLMLSNRDQGVRSFIEDQMWGIWIAVLLFTMLGLGVIHLTNTRPSLFALWFAANAGMGFAMMGLVFYKRFLIVAALFLAVTLCAAAVPSVQWWLIGATWWVAMFVPGVSAFREKKLRDQGADQTTIL